MATQPEKERWNLLRTENFPLLYQFKKVYTNPTNGSEYTVKYDKITGNITEEGLQNNVLRLVNGNDTTYVRPQDLDKEEKQIPFTQEELKRQYVTGQHYPRYKYLNASRTDTPKKKIGGNINYQKIFK